MAGRRQVCADGGGTGVELGSSNGSANQQFQIPLEYVESTGIVNDHSVHPVRVWVGGRSAEIGGNNPPAPPAVEWQRAENNDFNAVDDFGNPLYDANSEVFTVDYAAGKIKFGDGNKGKIHSLNQLIGCVFSHDFNVSLGVEAWIHEKVKAVKLDLGTINEDNAPRHPQYKDSESSIDKKKYGVIFSEVPLVVWGVAKVPVTIVCTGDLYVGPINATYLNPNNIDEWWKTIGVLETEDSDNLAPVGLITKGRLFYDYTLAYSYPYPLYNNTFTLSTNGAKTLILNKVCLYYSWIFNPLQSSWYRDRFGIIAVGAVSYPTTTFGWGFYPMQGSPRIIGSIYYCADNNLISRVASTDTVMDYYISSGAAGPTAYANSFRRTPPHHIPKNIYITSYRMLESVDRAENFLKELDNYLTEEVTETYRYSAKFEDTIKKLLNALEGVE